MSSTNSQPDHPQDDARRQTVLLKIYAAVSIALGVADLVWISITIVNALV